MATYTPTQRQAVLCMLAYMSSFAEGPVARLQATMSEKLDLILSLHDLQALIGRWQVVWGPVIFQAHGSDVADNTMFAARSLEEAQMVISIAGTNPYSWYNWLFQDFPVHRKVAWPTDTGKKAELHPKISLGTANGLRALQSMRDDGRSLLDFLQDYLATEEQSLQIVVTGHSLGGALSPAMAVYLADMQSVWDPDGRAVLSVMSMAGPTPGNLDFALYAQEMLDGRIQRIWNEKDIVPHAWDKIEMAKLSTLYGPDIKPNLLARLIIPLTRWIANRTDYAHLQPDAPALPGSIVPANLADDLLPPSILSKLLPQYMLQMGYQHLAAYYDMLEMDEFAQIMGDTLPDALSGPDLEELRRRVGAQSPDDSQN